MNRRRILRHGVTNQRSGYGKPIMIAKTAAAGSFAEALATEDNGLPIQAVTAI
jgi:hypothetical protein